jgi:radical SAM enzyme (TIGR04100 family)
MTIAYPVKKGLYLNITNRCPCDCAFCLRKNADGVYGSDSLWLDHEPSFNEIIAALNKHNLADFSEIVFCGYGEPTERIDIVCEVAKHIKDTYPSIPIRLNTNGLADLIHSKPTAHLLNNLIDTVSISLNTPNSADYEALCRPKFGSCSWQAMIDFAKGCTSHVPNVILSIVGEPITSPKKQEECHSIAESIGAKLRIRPYE